MKSRENVRSIKGCRGSKSGGREKESRLNLTLEVRAAAQKTKKRGRRREIVRSESTSN